MNNLLAEAMTEVFIGQNEDVKQGVGNLFGDQLRKALLKWQHGAEGNDAVVGDVGIPCGGLGVQCILGQINLKQELRYEDEGDLGFGATCLCTSTFYSLSDGLLFYAVLRPLKEEPKGFF